LAKGAELPTQSPLQEVAAGSCGGGEEEADDAMSPELPLPPVRQQQQGEWKPDSARLMESWLQPSPEASSAPGTEGVQAEAAAAEAAAPREEVEQPSPEAAQAEAAEAARQAAQAEAAAAQSMVEQELLLGDMTIVNPRRTLCGSPNKLEQCLARGGETRFGGFTPPQKSFVTTHLPGPHRVFLMPGFYLEDPERRITASQTNGSFGALVKVVCGDDFAREGVAYIKFEDIRRVCPLLPACKGGEKGQGSLSLAVDWLTAAQSGGTGRHPLVFWRQKVCTFTPSIPVAIYSHGELVPIPAAGLQLRVCQRLPLRAEVFGVTLTLELLRDVYKNGDLLCNSPTRTGEDGYLRRLLAGAAEELEFKTTLVLQPNGTMVRALAPSFPAVPRHGERSITLSAKVASLRRSHLISPFAF